MLPNGMKLEKLLKRLFEDDDESDLEDIVVLGRRIRPLEIRSECCTYSYATYGG